MAGAIFGAALARTGDSVQVATVFAEATLSILDQHGLEVTIVVATFGFGGLLVWRCMNWVIEGRDREIHRLVEEKRWWQERYAGVVPSSSTEADDHPQPEQADGGGV